ncbi:GNAT family N-acetyltransferase [Bdellovibrio sp. HCB290]|uniref:GNAT family N-acetyltransferase n=1 Tax=Bdellovibrio sp. HCB290 TaxID=3394356 RepID=UPI0039B47F82
MDFTDIEIRLRKFVESDIALAEIWYTDPVVLAGVISPEQKDPLSEDYLRAMYNDLGSRGELSVIEVNANGEWLPIGEVTLASNTLPIVIGDPRYRGRGVGKKVIQLLLSQAREKGWDKVTLKGIYKDNISSQRAFESCGFIKVGESDKCYIYELVL